MRYWIAARAGQCHPAGPDKGLQTEQRRVGERDAERRGEPELRLGRSEVERAQEAIDDLSRTQGIHHCSLFVWDPSVGRLRLAAMHWGAGEDLGEVRVGHWTISLNGICGRAFQAGLPCQVDNIEDDPGYLSFPGSRTRSELAVPILIDGRPCGVVNLESPRRAAFGPAEVEAVSRWAASFDGLIRSFFEPSPGPGSSGSGAQPSDRIEASS